MPDDVPHPRSGSATIREVYALVNEVRDDLGGRIDATNQSIADLRATVSTIVTSHEHRLTVNEEQITTLSQQHAALISRVDGHGHDLGVIKDRMREDEAATKALSDARDKHSINRRWVIGTVLGTVGAMASISYILVAVVH